MSLPYALPYAHGPCVRPSLVCPPCCLQVGFLLVMTAAMLAGLRWTITQVLLQGGPGHGETHCSGRVHRGEGEAVWQAICQLGGIAAVPL